MERGVLFQFAALEDRATIETFEILGIVVSSDDLRPFVFAAIRHASPFLSGPIIPPGRPGPAVAGLPERLTKSWAAISLVREHI
ncbi:MAG TPA: hypothetical protein VEJ67_10490 [Candidatus Cybelea sp.]|nr:hypothetical protein [Candidatus Cybelea sp.]